MMAYFSLNCIQIQAKPTRFGYIFKHGQGKIVLNSKTEELSNSYFAVFHFPYANLSPYTEQHTTKSFHPPRCLCKILCS